MINRRRKYIDTALFESTVSRIKVMEEVCRETGLGPDRVLLAMIGASIEELTAAVDILDSSISIVGQ